MKNLYVIYDSHDYDTPITLAHCLKVKGSVARNIMSANPKSKYLDSVETFIENYERISGREYVPGSAKCVGYHRPICYLVDSESEQGYSGERSENGVPVFRITKAAADLERNRYPFAFDLEYYVSFPNKSKVGCIYDFTLQYAADAEQIKAIAQLPMTQEITHEITKVVQATCDLQGQDCLCECCMTAKILLDEAFGRAIYG